MTRPNARQLVQALFGRRRRRALTLSNIASISAITRSGAAYWIMWPTPGSTISLAFCAAFASGCEWMWVETVLSTPPADDGDRRRDTGVARRLFGHRRAQRHQILGIGDELARAQQQVRRGIFTKPSGITCGANTLRVPGSASQ